MICLLWQSIVWSLIHLAIDINNFSARMAWRLKCGIWRINVTIGWLDMLTAVQYKRQLKLKSNWGLELLSISDNVSLVIQSVLVQYCRIFIVWYLSVHNFDFITKKNYFRLAVFVVKANLKVRDVARTLIEVCIFIYSCFARRVSFQIKFKLINLKRNLSGKSWIYEYTPPPPN